MDTSTPSNHFNHQEFESHWSGRMFPDNWDLSSLPKQPANGIPAHTSLESGEINHLPVDDEEMRKIAEAQLDPYLDGKQSIHVRD